MKFTCNESNEFDTMELKYGGWVGELTKMATSGDGNFAELEVRARLSRLVVIIGKLSDGNVFVAVPGSGASMMTSDLREWRRIADKLSRKMNRVDAITVAEGIKALARKRAIPELAAPFDFAV